MGFPNYCRGDVNAIPADFTTGSVFEIGEPVGLVANKVIGCSAASWWNTDLATTRTNFVAALFGVALQQHISTASGQVYGNGTTNKIVVGTTGEYWARISGVAPAFGDWVSPTKDTGNNLLPTTIERVTTEATAIGRLVELVSSTVGIYRLKQVVLPGV